jgi:hypothetical protein
MVGGSWCSHGRRIEFGFRFGSTQPLTLINISVLREQVTSHDRLRHISVTRVPVLDSGTGSENAGIILTCTVRKNGMMMCDQRGVRSVDL